MPITPHSSHAGKNAPNRSNDGAPLAEQPLSIDAKHRRAILNRVRKRAVISQAKGTGVMALPILIEFGFRYRSLFPREMPMDAMTSEWLAI